MGGRDGQSLTVTLPCCCFQFAFSLPQAFGQILSLVEILPSQDPQRRPQGQPFIRRIYRAQRLSYFWFSFIIAKGYRGKAAKGRGLRGDVQRKLSGSFPGSLPGECHGAARDV